MNKKRTITILTIILLAFISPIFAKEAPPILVSGFINKGRSSDDNINTVISKSLITYLSKIPGLAITPYDTVVEVVTENGYWKKRSVDVDLALSMALSFDVKQVVVGDYKINNSTETIVVNFYIYDVVTGELKIKRTFDGKAGIDIFDTVDEIIKNATLLITGRNVVLAQLKINIKPTEMDYNVIISGKFQKKINCSNSYDDSILANEDVDVVLKMASSGKQVWHEVVKIKGGETYEINYTPAGLILVKATGIKKAEVFLDGKFIGETDDNGDFVVDNILVKNNHSIILKKDGRTIAAKTVKVREGQRPIVPVGDDARVLWIPVSFLEGGLGLSAGVELRYLRIISSGIRGGFIYHSGYEEAIPIMTIDTMARVYRLKTKIGRFDFRAGMAVMFYITMPYETTLISPIIKTEVEWRHIFFNLGLRISPYQTYGGVKPYLGLGYRF